MTFNDLYNNFKIVEQQLKKSRSTSSSPSSENLAFVSSTSNISHEENCDVSGVSTASPKVITTSSQNSTAILSDETVYAFIASQHNGSQLFYEDLLQLHDDDLEEIDLK